MHPQPSRISRKADSKMCATKVRKLSRVRNRPQWQSVAVWERAKGGDSCPRSRVPPIRFPSINFVSSWLSGNEDWYPF